MLFAVIAGGVFAILLVAHAVWPNYRARTNGPEITIGKSGEMKSPGGIAADRRI
jgi:hypothetical protein